MSKNNDEFKLDFDANDLLDTSELNLNNFNLIDEANIINTEEILETKEILGDLLTPTDLDLNLDLDNIDMMLDTEGLEDLNLDMELEAKTPEEFIIDVANIDTPRRREEFKNYRITHLDFLRTQEVKAIQNWFNSKRGTLHHQYRLYYNGKNYLQKLLSDRITLEFKRLQERYGNLAVQNALNVSKLLEERTRGFIDYSLGRIKERNLIPHINWEPSTDIESLLDQYARANFPYQLEDYIMHEALVKEIKDVNTKYDYLISQFKKEWGEVEWVVGIHYEFDYTQAYKSIGDRKTRVQVITNTGRILDMPMKYIPKTTEAFTSYRIYDIKDGHLSSLAKTINYTPLALYSEGKVDPVTFEVKPIFVVFPLEIPMYHMSRIVSKREKFKEQNKIVFKENKEFPYTGKFPIINLEEMTAYKTKNGDVFGDFRNIIPCDVTEIGREEFTERYNARHGFGKTINNITTLDKLAELGHNTTLENIQERTLADFEFQQKLERMKLEREARAEDDNRNPHVISVTQHVDSVGYVQFIYDHEIKEEILNEVCDKLNIDRFTLNLFLTVMTNGNSKNLKELFSYGGNSLNPDEYRTIVTLLHKKLIVEDIIFNYNDNLLRDSKHFWLMGFINDALRYKYDSVKKYEVNLPYSGSAQMNNYNRLINSLLSCVPDEFIPSLWEGINTLYEKGETKSATLTNQEKGVSILLSVLVQVKELEPEVRNSQAFIKMPDYSCEALTALMDICPDLSVYDVPLTSVAVAKNMDNLILRLLKIALKSSYNAFDLKGTKGDKVLTMRDFIPELFNLLSTYKETQVENGESTLVSAYDVYEYIHDNSYLFDEISLVEMLVFIYEVLGRYISLNLGNNLASSIIRENSLVHKVLYPGGINYREIISERIVQLEEENNFAGNQEVTIILDKDLNTLLENKINSHTDEFNGMDMLQNIELTMDEEEVIHINLVKSLRGLVSKYFERYNVSYRIYGDEFLLQELRNYLQDLDRNIKSYHFMKKEAVKEYYTDGDVYENVYSKMKTYFTVLSLIKEVRRHNLMWLSNIEELVGMLIEYHQQYIRRFKKDDDTIRAINDYRRYLREEQAKDQTRMTKEQLDRLSYDELTDPEYGLYSALRVGEMLKTPLDVVDVAVSIKEYGSEEFINNLPKALKEEVRKVRTLSLEEMNRYTGDIL